MSTATKTITETLTDPLNANWKYPIAYGFATHCLTVIADRIARAKREGEKIDPNDWDLNWAISQFKIADDALHAENTN